MKKKVFGEKLIQKGLGPLNSPFRAYLNWIQALISIHGTFFLMTSWYLVDLLALIYSNLCYRGAKRIYLLRPYYPF